MFTLAFSLVVEAIVVSTPPVKAAGGAVKLKVRTQPYIPGVAAGGQIWVSVDIESPYAWDNTVDGIVGWDFDVHVDPDVLEPMGAYGADFGYFLYDFVDWNMYVGHYPTILVGSINVTSGDIIDISEFIMGYGFYPGQLDVGAGGNSTDPWWYGGEGTGGYGLCRLRFKSKSQTTATVINITDAAYWTMDSVTGLGVRHVIPEEDITNGYYSSAPAADFTYAPEEPLVNQEVTFNASTSYDPNEDITSYEWDFGDDNTAIYVDANLTDSANHTYTEGGTYTVKLNVTNSGGLWDTANKSITVSAPPVASFTYSPSEPRVGDPVIFNATASYDPDGGNAAFPSGIVSYEWDFGDGGTGTGNITEHTYTDVSEYPVTLTVTDDEGLTNSTTDTVMISRHEGGVLDIEMDVGSIHFPGELAEFYVLTSFMGEPVDAEISVTLYHKGTAPEPLTGDVEPVAEGLYRVPYTIHPTASSGTYVLVVKASFSAARGISVKSFLLSETLTGWDPLLISIDENVGTIRTDVGSIDVKLDSINATLVSIENTTVTINSTIGELTASVYTISATITSIEDWGEAGGILVTIETDIGAIQTNIDAINLKLTEINETVAIVDWTDLMQSIEVELAKINATIAEVKDGLVTIDSTLGGIQRDLEDVKDYISFELVNVTGDIKEGLLNVTAAITDAEGNILLELGQVEVKLEDVDATLTDIDGNLVTIKTDIGTIKGKITSVQGDVATIETDIGIIKTILEEWTGVTTSSITTPAGTFDVMVLTNSTLEGPATFSDNTLTLIVSGQTGTAGVANVMIPRQLLVGLGSNVENLAVTINGRPVSFTYTEESELYMVRVLYSHSKHTIKVHLAESQPPLPLMWVLLVIALTIAIPTIGTTPFILKARKKPSSHSSSTNRFD